LQDHITKGESTDHVYEAKSNENSKPESRVQSGNNTPMKHVADQKKDEIHRHINMAGLRNQT
jgi:hypothetical protein